MSKTSAILGETHQDCQSEINVCGHRSNLYLRGPARKITLSMVSVNRIAFPCINGEPSSIVWQYDIIWNKINLLQANLCPALSVDGRAGTVFPGRISLLSHCGLLAGFQGILPGRPLGVSSAGIKSSEKELELQLEL